jgi:hypothetical protein
MVLGRPKISKLAHAFMREYSYRRLKSAQFLGRLGVFLAASAGGGPRDNHGLLPTIVAHHCCPPTDGRRDAEAAGGPALRRGRRAWPWAVETFPRPPPPHISPVIIHTNVLKTCRAARKCRYRPRWLGVHPGTFQKGGAWRGRFVDIITRTSHYTSFTMGGAGCDIDGP